MDELSELLQLLEAEAEAEKKNKDELWYRGDLRFLLHDAQKLIYDKYYSQQQRETVILASRRFGKSFLGLILCLEHCIINPRTTARFIPPEIKQGWGIVMPTMLKLEQLWPHGLIRFMASEKAWRIGRDSYLYIGGFDSQRDSNRGSEASLIICDESGFTNPESYLYMLKSVLKPQLLTTRGRLLLLSSPSKVPDHPFMVETVQEAKFTDRLWKFTIYDNPLLDGEQIEEAKRDCGGEDTDDFKREYLCESVRAKNIVVLPRFDKALVEEEIHVEDYEHRAIVGDFGGVQDKTVIHAVAYKYKGPTDGIVYFLDERVYDPNTPTSEIVKGINELHAAYIKPSKAENQDDTAYLDCPGQLKVDLQNLHGLNVRIPIKDDFHAGINLINIYLNRGRLKVHPRCKFTLVTFEGARFNERRTDYVRTPLLGHCDAIASAIYCIRMVNKDVDPHPFAPADIHNSAHWRQPSRTDNRESVANAIFGRVR